MLASTTADFHLFYPFGVALTWSVHHPCAWAHWSARGDEEAVTAPRSAAVRRQRHVKLSDGHIEYRSHTGGVQLLTAVLFPWKPLLGESANAQLVQRFELALQAIGKLQVPFRGSWAGHLQLIWLIMIDACFVFSVKVVFIYIYNPLTSFRQKV